MTGLQTRRDLIKTIAVLTGSAIVQIPTVFLSMLSSGCGAPPVQGMPLHPTKSLPPLKIAIFEDKSGSTESARVQPITVGQIEPLLDLLNRRGGELAYGVIKERSNRGLLRIVIPETPVAPVEPDSRQNPFLLAEQRAVYDKKVADFRDAQNRRNAIVNPQFAAFRSQLEKMVSDPRNAKMTDVWGAIRRMELYMNEPTTSKEPPRRYAILSTDGIDTTGAPKPEFQGGTTLIVVNGSASLGVLDELQPLRFENLESAIAYVLAQEGR